MNHLSNDNKIIEPILQAHIQKVPLFNKRLNHLGVMLINQLGIRPRNSRSKGKIRPITILHTISRTTTINGNTKVYKRGKCSSGLE